jgi:hypothetical protein
MILWLSQGTCIWMYIDAVANSVLLYLRHDFYNIIFKIKHKLYIASGSGPTPHPTPSPMKNFRYAPVSNSKTRHEFEVWFVAYRIYLKTWYIILYCLG